MARYVVARDWDKAVMLAAARDEQEVLEELVRLYADYEEESKWTN